MNTVQKEKEILHKISKGDRRAFTQIFDFYHQNLAVYVYKITASREAAQEIVQETFIKVWEKRETLCNINNFKGYLFTLSKNKTLDYLRRLATERTHQLYLSKELFEESYMIDTPSLKEQYNLIIERTVNQLPPQQQKVYYLSRHEKLKYEEIAAQMGISKETEKKHMQLSLHFLKQNIKIQIENSVLILLSIFAFLN